MTQAATKTEPAPKPAPPLKPASPRIAEYLEQVDKRVTKVKAEVAKLDQEREELRRYLQAPFREADGLRAELLAELRELLPVIDPGSLEPGQVAEYSQALLLLSRAAGSNINGVNAARWLELWAGIDLASLPQVVAFYVFASQAKALSASRPSITPFGVPVYAAYLTACGQDPAKLIEVDQELTALDEIAKEYSLRGNTL